MSAGGAAGVAGGGAGDVYDRFHVGLEDGSRLGAVDAFQGRWTRKAPRRRAPFIKSLVWPGILQK